MKPASLQSTQGYAVAWAPLLFCSQSSQAHVPDCGTVGKKKKETTARLEDSCQIHSDVFRETSSISRTHVVKRMRQKWKIVAFVVPVVPKRIVSRYRKLPAGCVTVLKSLRIESSFAALLMLTYTFLSFPPPSIPLSSLFSQCCRSFSPSPASLWCCIAAADSGSELLSLLLY